MSVYSRKHLLQNFIATDLGLQRDSYFQYPSISLDSAAVCSRRARKRLFLSPLLISRQMNHRCVLSVFIRLHYLPNAIWVFVTSHILFKPDTILTSYTSIPDILWPFCTAQFQCMQNSKWISVKQILSAVFAFPDSHWCSSLCYSRKWCLETSLWKVIFYCSLLRKKNIFRNKNTSNVL